MTRKMAVRLILHPLPTMSTTTKVCLVSNTSLTPSGTLQEMWETYKGGEVSDPMQLWKNDRSLFWKEMLKRW